MKIFLYLLILFIPSILFIGVDIKYFINSKTKSSIIKTIFKDFFLINLSSLSVLTLFCGFNNIFEPLKHSNKFFIVFALTSVLVSLIYLFIKIVVSNYFIKQKAEIKSKKRATTLYILSIFFMFLGAIFLTGTIWAKNTYYDIDFIQVWITLFSPAVGTDLVIIVSCLEKVLLLSVWITYLFALIFYKRMNYRLINKTRFSISDLFRRSCCLTLSITLLVSGIGYAGYVFDFNKFFISLTQTSSYIEDNYKDPSLVKLEFPNKKRNLIHFYLESIENSYFDKQNGGNMDENLMPELTKLTNELISKKQAFNFSHLDKNKGLGGPLETEGATWSVASMVNQFFGVPMKASMFNNTYGKPGEFFKGAIGVGDILAKVNYNQTLMLGADSDFGGLSYMFDLHGKFKDMDYKYAKNHNMLPSKNYKVNWGYEDKKIYKFAKDEITRLANQKDDSNNNIPFYFVMENADTHFPGFSFSSKGEPIYGSSGKKDYAKTISYSDKDLTEFIRWIIDQPFYKDTTIIVIGDHLSMDKNFFTKERFPNYLRTTYNLIINPDSSIDTLDETRFYNRKWATYDMMPTLLNSIGVKIEGNRLGIGTNLFSKEKTLYERDGYELANDKFIRKSPFYNKVLLGSKRTYDGKNLVIN